MDNYDIPLAKMEDVEHERNINFDDLLNRIDNEVCEFKRLYTSLQEFSKDYRGFDFTKELAEHLKDEIGV